jgi:hypothetical protein
MVFDGCCTPHCLVSATLTVSFSIGCHEPSRLATTMAVRERWRVGMKRTGVDSRGQWSARSWALSGCSVRSGPVLLDGTSSLKKAQFVVLKQFDRWNVRRRFG